MKRKGIIPLDLFYRNIRKTRFRLDYINKRFLIYFKKNSFRTRLRFSNYIFIIKNRRTLDIRKNRVPFKIKNFSEYPGFSLIQTDLYIELSISCLNLNDYFLLKILNLEIKFAISMEHEQNEKYIVLIHGVDFLNNLSKINLANFMNKNKKNCRFFICNYNKLKNYTKILHKFFDYRIIFHQNNLKKTKNRPIFWNNFSENFKWMNFFTSWYFLFEKKIKKKNFKILSFSEKFFFSIYFFRIKNKKLFSKRIIELTISIFSKNNIATMTNKFKTLVFGNFHYKPINLEKFFFWDFLKIIIYLQNNI
jgi:hypothetical protein